MSDYAEVAKLAQEWGRPDLWEAYKLGQLTRIEFQVVLARVTVEVAVAKAAKAAAWSAFKDMP